MEKLESKGTTSINTQYSYRKSILEKERTYQLEDTALTVLSQDEILKSIPYSTINSIRLSFLQKESNGIYQARIHSPVSENLLIQNQHFRGMNDFEYRDAAYTNFITQLHRAVQQTKPGVVFSSGQSKPLHFFLLAFYLLIFIGSAIVTLACLITFNFVGIGSALLCWKSFVWYKNQKTKGKPRTYPAEKIPLDLLP